MRAPRLAENALGRLDGAESLRKGCADMLDRVRSSLHRAITTPFGDGFLPVRVPKDLARRVNMVLGQPICSADELERRRTGEKRLTKLRADALRGVKAEAGAREPAPVIIYFEKDRNARLLGRMKDALEAKSIAFTALEVDTATKAFVMREAKCKEDELPIVFVAATPIGGYNELIEWDVSGKLAEAVFGAPPLASRASP